MIVSPARSRLGRVLNDVRSRRGARLDKVAVRSQLASYRTTSERAELSAIATRNGHVDTGELRLVLSRNL
jgi:hypothetical protein